MSRSTHATPPRLVQEYALIAHIVLEDLVRYGLPANSDGMYRFVTYLGVAHAMAGSVLKSPPKKLIEAQRLLDEWQRTGSLVTDESTLPILCAATDCADALWRRIPLTELLTVLNAAKAKLEAR